MNTILIVIVLLSCSAVLAKVMPDFLTSVWAAGLVSRRSPDRRLGAVPIWPWARIGTIAAHAFPAASSASLVVKALTLP